MSIDRIRQHSIYKAMRALPIEEKRKFAKYFLKDNPAKDYFSNRFWRRTWASLKRAFSNEYSKRVEEIQATVLAIEEDLTNTGDPNIVANTIIELAKEAGLEEFNIKRIRHSRSIWPKTLLVLTIIAGGITAGYANRNAILRTIPINYKVTNQQVKMIQRYREVIDKEHRRFEECEADWIKCSEKVRDVISQRDSFKDKYRDAKLEGEHCMKRLKELQRKFRELTGKYTESINRHIMLLGRCSRERDECRQALEAWKNGVQTE